MLQEKMPPALAEAYRNMAYYPPLPGYMGDIIQIGDRYTARIHLYRIHSHFPAGPLLTGVITYIHPKRRFFNVRIELNGGTVTQSFRTFVDETYVFEEARYYKLSELYNKYPLSDYERGYLANVLNGGIFDDPYNSDKKLEKELQIIFSEYYCWNEEENSEVSKVPLITERKNSGKRFNTYEQFY